MIFIDRAIGSADLVVPLRKAGLPAELAHLEYADVEFIGRGVKGTPVMVGVEVKRLSELTSDFDRLAGHQIPKMLAHYDHRWLVYEGEWDQDRHGLLLRRTGRRNRAPQYGQAQASALRKKLLTLEMCGGMHRQQTKDRVDTVRFLHDLYRWFTDDDMDEHKSHIVVYQPHGLIPLTKVQQAIAAWPHLSTKRCKAVAAAFKGSIRLATSASVNTWAALEIPDDEGRVRKLGRTTAEAIVRFLNGEGA